MKLVQKLRGRSFAELRERAAQATAKRAERWGLRDSGEPSDAALFTSLQTVKDSASWRQHFATRRTPRFFAGCESPSESVAAIRQIDPTYATEVVRRANGALGGRFDLLGYRDLSFGDPVDWHLDPVAGVRAPRLHWSSIAYLDPRIAGDHKVVWELNRQQWLVDLGAAWWLTGDERYARAMIATLQRWMDANPPKIGVNWASSLEVAFRAMSWIWALEFLRRSPFLDDATFARLTKFLVIHARHIERYLSTYFSPNTHLTGEALGLFYIATYFPELRQSARWRELGARVLVEQLPRHVRPDGVYFEQAVHYQRYTIDFYTHLWLLDEANGGTLSVEIAPNLAALLEHMQCLTRGDGSVPLFGDEDGGRLFTFDALPIADVRSALATGAVLL
ncbi:MAG: heparinase II/III family protein, partial [Gemmatimonadota bacterium]